MLHVRSYLFLLITFGYSLACSNNLFTEFQDHQGLKLVKNEQVQKWLNYYQHKDRYGMKLYLKRAALYTGEIRKRLREEGLPEDLAYLPIIESGFKSQAKSSQGAVGHWQFIASTGKSYGLEISDWVDERRDIELATEAAIKHFKRLHRMFGDWHLVLAAYNAGEGRLKGFIRRYKTRDFFEISRWQGVPSETKNYVPKFLAVAHIAKNPQKYGFKKYRTHTGKSYEELTVERSVSLKKLADQMEIPLQQLEDLNAKYKRGWVPAYQQKNSQVKVPKGSQAVAYAALKDIWSKGLVSKK